MSRRPTEGPVWHIFLHATVPRFFIKRKMYIANIFVSEKNYALVGVGFTFTVLALVLVGLRVITRIWLVRNFGADDGFIVVSTVSPTLLAMTRGLQNSNKLLVGQCRVFGCGNGT